MNFICPGIKIAAQAFRSGLDGLAQLKEGEQPAEEDVTSTNDVSAQLLGVERMLLPARMFAYEEALLLSSGQVKPSHWPVSPGI